MRTEVQWIRRFQRAFLMLGAAATLTGCASFSGTAKPIKEPSTRLAALGDISEKQALLNYYAKEDSSRDNLDRENYRNYVSAVYEGAADAQYQAFRVQLAREIKGTSFASTVGVLLMNGAAIVSGAEASRALAAGAAVTTGAYGSFSKDVLFDRTLQALLAAMDGRRSEAKIRLRAGRQLGVDRYSLRDAFDDIADLERQASLDVAVQQLSALATTDAAAKEKLLKSLYQVPLYTPAQEARLAPVINYVDALLKSNKDADVTMLKAIAMAAKIEIKEGEELRKTRNNIIDWLNRPEQVKNIDTVIANLNSVTKQDFK